MDEQGQPIEVVDRLADRLIRAARRLCANPTAFIADRDLFGDLADHERFVTAYRSALASLHERVARMTLKYRTSRSDLAHPPSLATPSGASHRLGR